jgi:hypothetical protein
MLTRVLRKELQCLGPSVARSGEITGLGGGSGIGGQLFQFFSMNQHAARRARQRERWQFRLAVGATGRRHTDPASEAVPT